MPSSAEKQRAYRERQKERARQAAREGNDKLSSIVESSFALHWSSRSERQEVAFIEEALASIGLSLDFSKDEDPECDEGLAGTASNRGALGRAERAVGALLDSATALAGIINRFKLAEIERALAQIEQADLPSPELKAKALKEAVELEGMRKLLRKEVRRSLMPTVITNGDTATV
ncbi:MULTISPECIES: hypothetical protein [Methylobacteriaceae]|uniref:hypothetical protein n=1 Tax=Methylobacteriaceae TaxID=119045 RepID=UPI002F351AB4